MENPTKEQGQKIKVRGRKTTFTSIRDYHDLAFGLITPKEYAQRSGAVIVEDVEIEIDPSNLE